MVMSLAGLLRFAASIHARGPVVNRRVTCLTRSRGSVGMMVELNPEQIARFREDGFLVVEKLIDAETIDALRERFDRLFRGDRESLVAEREQLKRRIRLVDAVLDSARALNRNTSNF